MEKIDINTDFIQLVQFLKWGGIGESCGQVKPMIEEQLISVNGILETARRKKLKPGDVVKIQGLGAWQVAAEGE